MLLFTLVLAALHASAATVEVTAGQDWCAVANAAAPGDEIVLLSGVHAGPCGLRANGAAGSAVVLRSVSGATIEYDGRTSNVVELYADYVTLRELSFGPTQPDVDAVKIRSREGIEISACSFREIGGISISANSGDTDGLIIADNSFVDLQATGVYLGCHEGECAARDYAVTGNVIDGVTSSNVGYGMEFKLGSYGRVADNIISSTQGPAIEVYGGATTDPWTIVEGNLTVGAATSGTLEIGGGPALVRNNIIVGGAGGGLVAYDYGGRGLDRSVHLLGNTVIGEEAPAIVLYGWGPGRDLRLVGNAWSQTAGPAPETSGAEDAANVACDETCFADAAAWDFTPTDSQLQGAGVDDVDLTEDWCGASRTSPPSAGALETATGPLSVAPKPSCMGGADTGLDDTGTPGTGGTVPGGTGAPGGDTGIDSTDDDVSPHEEPPGGCACDTGSATGGWLLGISAALVWRRRAPHS